MSAKLLLRRYHLWALFGLAILIAMGGVVVLRGLGNNSSTEPMTQDWFIERAIEIARAHGNDEPRDIAAATMTYAEFEALLDDEAWVPEERGAIPVWVVTMKGTVRFPAPPGPPGHEESVPPSEYDNMYVILNALTGEVMGVGARAPGHEISLPVSEVPPDFPSQPETPPEPTPKAGATATPVPKP